MDVKTQIFLHSLYMYGETSETHITKILLSKSKVAKCAVKGNGYEVGNWLRSVCVDVMGRPGGISTADTVH